MEKSSSPDVKSPPSVRAMEQYHEYLRTNYLGGVDRFFSPTGFLSEFETKVKLEAAEMERSVFARTMDEARKMLEPVVSGTEGVFDLAAEPGSGKTTTLPFKFPTKRVTVALPTPFDAFGAYLVATGSCKLELQGLQLGDPDSRVRYTDSYMAVSELSQGKLQCDILIVDECDSGKGITSFLASVKAKGVVIVRMSASHGRTRSGPSKAFQVAEVNTMPDARKDLPGFSNMVSRAATGRSLVLLPDAQSAMEAHKMIEGSVLLTSDAPLAKVASIMCDQKSDVTLVADDVCARGLNLNLDMMFDSQLITTHGVTRNLTEAELYQRKNRVGRSREGWYYSPGLNTMSHEGASDIDVCRNNVARVLHGMEQKGSDMARVKPSMAKGLMCSSIEPYVVMAKVRAETAVTPPEDRLPSPECAELGPSSAAGDRRSVSSTVSSRASEVVKAPSWVCYFATGTDRPKADSYAVTYEDGSRAFLRKKRKPSTSSSGRGEARGGVFASMVDSAGYSPHDTSALAIRSSLPLARSAPYAATTATPSLPAARRVEIPDSPPAVNLQELTYDMNWPAMIRDRFYAGASLPTIIPPDGWRHTSSGGFKVDWMVRLQGLADKDWDFADKELETVCRAWNLLVARRWVKGSSGFSAADLDGSLEFCVRYFQAHYMHTFSS